MSTLWKQTMAGLRVLLVLTVLLGVVYPLAIWGIGRLPGLSANAEGSLIYQNGRPVGSELIGIDLVDERAKNDPTQDRWFHNRPSALTKDEPSPGDTASSGGSNRAGDNEDLLKAVQDRKTAIAAREQVDAGKIPADAVTASASGLDPHISPAYAGLQAPRVARENGVDPATVRRLIEENTVKGVGEPGVNVLKLNLAVQAARR
ncbi:potassium-transporting ATPase subunit C [Crossiella cryophila]|uniref:potassium-transporting ATPase subunit C n=1 Tax=Crossiella cryophila TaxID=43355 RepID=UPI00160993C6|nr:potassium-transporting ATPase subunit C [Crossiella cryophila]